MIMNFEELAHKLAMLTQECTAIYIESELENRIVKIIVADSGNSLYDIVESYKEDPISREESFTNKVLR